MLPRCVKPYAPHTQSFYSILQYCPWIPSIWARVGIGHFSILYWMVLLKRINSKSGLTCCYQCPQFMPLVLRIILGNTLIIIPSTVVPILPSTEQRVSRWQAPPGVSSGHSPIDPWRHLADLPITTAPVNFKDILQENAELLSNILRYGHRTNSVY